MASRTRCDRQLTRALDDRVTASSLPEQAVLASLQHIRGRKPR